jgi:Putative bacterial sensory transduction regulator
VGEPVAQLMKELGVQGQPAAGGGWIVHVPCAKRGHVAAQIIASERTLTLRAFLIRAPDRAHADVFRRLLRKNFSTRAWRFALDDAGDVYALADAPLDERAADALDGLLGALSVLVDEVYEGVLRTGFDVPDGVVVGAPPPSL